MSEQDIPNIPETSGLLELKDEAEQAAAAPDLQERVRQLTSKALHDRKLSLAEIREIMAAITEGVGAGLSGRGGELRSGLRQAVSGLDEAVGSAAEAVTLTLREAASQGRAFKEGEMKDSLERLKDLEGQLLDSLKDAARKSSGKLKEEWTALAEHMKTTGTDTGPRVRGALENLANGVSASSKAGQAGVREVVDTASERLSQVASGVLAALSESLKRQSERMRQ
jgi:hypothetical protein